MTCEMYIQDLQASLFSRLDRIEQLLQEYLECRKDAPTPDLNRYIDQYLKQISDGSRQSIRGKNFALSTVKAARQAMRQFELFQQTEGRRYGFEDMDMALYHQYTAFLKRKSYSVNTIGKCIKVLKGILHTAETEGLYMGSAWKDPRFKVTRADTDSIYLSREELERMMAVDLSGLCSGYTHARDIFMVGVWTAQRISDYNHLSRENIRTQKGITYLSFRQQKTGTRVAIPCNSSLKAILEKYDYRLPYLSDKLINRYIKEIARMAGLTDPVEIESTRGGRSSKHRIEKYKLIHSHTARRTGATLMYLAGVDLYDIMKVTGHSSPATLRRYIRADSLNIVEKLSGRYDYFR